MNLTKDEQYILYDWIDRYISPIKNTNYDINTSDLRKSFVLYYVHGFYISNNDMNEALCNKGYRPSNLSNTPYWVFNISSRCRALQEYHLRVSGAQHQCDPKYE